MYLRVSHLFADFKCRLFALLLFCNDYKALQTCFTILVVLLLSTKFLERDLFDSNFSFFSNPRFMLLFVAIYLVAFFVSYIPRNAVGNICTIVKRLSLSFLLAFASLYYFSSNVIKEVEKVASFIGQEVTIEGTVLSKQSTYQYLVSPKYKGIGNLMIRVPNFSVIHVGQRCTLRGRVVEPSSFEEFDYKRFLFRKGIYLILEVQEYSCSSSGNIFLLSRYKIERIIEKAIPEPESSLLIGIMFGSKRVFIKEFNNQLVSSGVSHIIAASGYNVALLTMGVERLTHFLKGKLSLLVKISSIWAFASFSGLSSSLIRASTMSTVYFISLLIGRYTTKSVAVVMCATILLLLNPFLLYDIGFLLSLISTIGLIFFPKCFNRYKLPSLIRDRILPTFTCTLFTLPILVIFFGKVSLVSIFTNFLIIPIIQTTIFWGLGITLINILFSNASFLYIVPYLQLVLFKHIVMIMGSIPMLEVNISPSLFAFLIYLIIFIFCIYYYPISNDNYYFKKAKNCFRKTL
jgi:ComEC/Rec2-related protein